MVAPADASTYEKSECVNADWTVVLPRRKRKNIRPKVSRPEQDIQQQPWAPPDSEIDNERESKLIQKMQICLKKLESSKFYGLFLNQINDPEVFACFLKLLGSEPKMNMVIYGIGSFESFEAPRLQLSLAIMMKRGLGWIGDIEVFDPVLSATEFKVLEALGCSVMSVDEQGRRLALKPTLFFMPHCEAVLYPNLMEANWKLDLLRNMALLGSSFEAYKHHSEVTKDYVASDYTKLIVAARSFTREFWINTDPDDHCRAFHESSWHFFSPEQGLPLVQM